MKNTKELYHLLYTIKYENNVSSLIDMGMSFSEIGDYYATLLKKGFIENKNGKIQISEKGEAKMEALKETFMHNNVKIGIIKPFLPAQITQIDENFIYLPTEFNK